MTIEKQYAQMMELNQKSIFERLLKAEDDAIINYNGFSNSKKSDVKHLIHNAILLKSAYDIIEEFDFEKYLGEKYIEKFFELCTVRNDVPFIMFISDEITDESNNYTSHEVIPLKEVKNRIDDTLAVFKWRDKAVYQAFYFDESIKEHYYQGDDYINADTDLPKDRQNKVCDVIDKHKTTDFFESLTTDIQTVMGEGNYEYDFFEFGPKGFMLFWWIERDKYTDILTNLKHWTKAKALEKSMAFRIKDLSKPDLMGEDLELVGAIEVVDNYYTH